MSVENEIKKANIIIRASLPLLKVTAALVSTAVTLVAEIIKGPWTLFKLIKGSKTK